MKKSHLVMKDGVQNLPADLAEFFSRSNIRKSEGVAEMDLTHRQSLIAKFENMKKLGNGVSTLLNGGVVESYETGLESMKAKIEENALVLLSRSSGNASFTLKDIPDQVKILSDVIHEPVELIEKILSEGTKTHYHTFFIWKDAEKTKKRWISAPDDDLKRIQRKILDSIIYKYFGVSPQTHGFVRNRSIKTNALKHLRKKAVLKIDLKDFFPSFTRDMARGALISRIPANMSKCFDVLVELCLLDGRLPQGAPTSPAIANIGASYMDFALNGMCRANQIEYTRYADDLTFSSDWNSLGKIVPIVRKIAGQFGFNLSNHKIRMFRKGRRQTVTGLVVNNDGFVSVPRPDRMRFRAKLHNILTGKTPREQVNMQEINGYAQFINMANPVHGAKFLAQLEQVKAMLSA